jgi:acetolactate synthase-1/2/3 large subunit
MAEVTVEDAAHGYVEMLSRLGVDYVFSSPGSEFVPMWEHLARYNGEGKKPVYMNVRHEGVALSMAKGYCMATGRAQVVLTHVSTGLMHGAMELKAAYVDQVPLLIMVGQNRTHDGEVYGGTPGAHYLSFTEVGGQERLAPYVKWGDSPETNGNALAAIQRAYEIASSGVRGPTLLNVSRELLFEKVTRMRLPADTARPAPVTAEPSALLKLRDMLLEAGNPMIYTRYLGRNRDAVASLVELSGLLGAPVFETPGYTNFPTDNLLHMGSVMGPYLKDADLVLVIDASSWPPWYPPGSIRKVSGARVAFMDPDPLQLKYPVYGYPSDLTLQADSGVALPQLVELLRQGRLDEQVMKERAERWAREHGRIREELRRKALAVSEASPIDARWLCHCINEAIDADTLIVNETMTHSGLIHAAVERNRVVPGSRYEADGPVAHTGLGQCLGVAVGVRLAEPGKTVVALVGDGAFNYNPVLAAFGAAQEHGAPFLTVIFNNGCYAAMKAHARFYPEGYSVRHNRYYGVSCGPSPDYSGVAEAFGGYGERVEDPSEVRAAIARALEAVRDGRLALLDVVLSPTISP